MPSKVVIYSKQDCHLCEIAKERVERVREKVSLDLEMVDITTSDDLMTRYGEKIPVVEVDGEEAFVYRVSEKLLLKRLKSGYY